MEPTSAFSIQYSVDMLFMVLVGGMGTIEGPIVGAFVLFALQETLSAYGAWYLVIVGGLAVVTTLVASRGLWGLASERLGWSGGAAVGAKLAAPERTVVSLVGDGRTCSVCPRPRSGWPGATTLRR